MEMHTPAKRVACDRCHRLKMRCIIEGDSAQQQCNRCCIANVNCNYSPPRKPGRPPTKLAGTLLQGLILSSGETIQSSSSPSTSRTVGTDKYGTEENWREEAFTKDDFFLANNESFGELPDNITSCLAPNFHALEELLNKSSQYERNTYLADDKREQVSLLSSLGQQSAQGQSDLLSEPSGQQMPTPTSSPGSSISSSAASEFAQHLSNFSKRRMDLDFSADVSPAKLEQVAAQVLDTSSAFIKLLQFSHQIETDTLSFASHRQPTLDTPSIDIDNDTLFVYSLLNPRSITLDSTNILQLVVFSMRLTVMHCGLYEAIYRYLQQADVGRNDSIAMSRNNISAGPPLPQLLSFSLAGIDLSPHPRFQLQLLLQTSTYYLISMHSALGGLEALRPDGPGLLMRTLMVQDQQARMGEIRVLLARLREEFGMLVQI
ncbi:hypothetical protein OIDMADRAFT_184958 [Oidiodendron maius Zn]|uniref:Zn(2)-C6 fungal-type domain-containing protein n=1 Tax=Oidiodendron maius (strain Zn) TaxID=913774 RepID=A0A0C3C255_OIDMZ|nr:hypothetical protein OIDMADRAFT_184958 [Oidiodendron maius Zn]